MKNIAVIGAGTMGNGIAHVFAQHGYKVNLIDISEESLKRGMQAISKNLDRMVSRERISEKDKENTLQNIQTFTALSEGVKNIDLVVEAATENEKLKLDIFSELENFCEEHVILASNTSSISITKIAGATKRPEKVIGMHFMNPVPVMELVEVLRGLQTSDQTAETTVGLARELGKTPLDVNDHPGVVSKRMVTRM